MQEFEDPQSNVKKAILEYEKKLGKVVEESVKAPKPSEALAEFISNIEDTKDERRLLNYRRYQKLWDEHEDTVASAFAQRKLQRFGPASKHKK